MGDQASVGVDAPAGVASFRGIESDPLLATRVSRVKEDALSALARTTPIGREFF